MLLCFRPPEDPCLLPGDDDDGDDDDDDGDDGDDDDDDDCLLPENIVS